MFVSPFAMISLTMTAKWFSLSMNANRVWSLSTYSHHHWFFGLKYLPPFVISSIVGLSIGSMALTEVLFYHVVRSHIDEFLVSWLGDTGNMARLLMTTSSGFDAAYMLALRTEAECADHELNAWLEAYRSQNEIDHWVESDSCSS